MNPFTIEEPTMNSATISRPIVASLAALNVRRGHLGDDLAARVSELETSLRALHEEFRHGGPPEEFARKAGRLIRLRNRAEAMRAAVDPDFTPADRPAVAGEVLGLLGTARLRADEATAWIRTTRPAMISRLKAELEEFDGQAKELADGYGARDFTVGTEHLQTGESTQLDEHLRRLASIFGRRAVLAARLELLVGGQDYVAAVAAAVDAAGGLEAVTATVADRLAAEMAGPDVQAAEARIRNLASRLASIDPDSELAAQLAGEKAAADDELVAARARVGRRAAASAAALVADVLAGDGGRARELERIAPKALAAALVAARAGGDQLEATVAAVLDEAAELEAGILDRSRAAAVAFAGR